MHRVTVGGEGAHLIVANKAGFIYRCGVSFFENGMLFGIANNLVANLAAVSFHWAMDKLCFAKLSVTASSLTCGISHEEVGC